MIDAMTTKGLWTSPGGKTPHATLYSAILREITDEIMTAVRAEVADLRGEPVPSEFFVPKKSYVDKR